MSDAPATDHRLELAAAILLALAAIATAWATYQSSVWRGKRPARAPRSQPESSRRARPPWQTVRPKSISRSSPSGSSHVRRQGKLSSFYRKRFRAEFEPRSKRGSPPGRARTERPALAVRDAAVPAGGVHQADALENQAGDFSLTVARNIERADRYMLAVVLFAIALFFAAISMRLRSRDIRIGILAAGYVLFVGTAVWLATQPIGISV